MQFWCSPRIFHALPLILMHIHFAAIHSDLICLNGGQRKGCDSMHFNSIVIEASYCHHHLFSSLHYVMLRLYLGVNTL